MNTPSRQSRIDWVDYAKGICIILVVMMHSTLGVEKAAGATSWLNGFIEWARPFRMPDFFLISGLFLASRINRPWRGYLDTKVLHFAYFYVLWMTIQFLTKGCGFYQESGAAGVFAAYLWAFVEPFGTLWFIYLLAVFFVTTKLASRLPPLAVFAAAAVLEMAPIATGYTVIDEFAARYVYFFAGFWLARYVLLYAEAVGRKSTLLILAGLAPWAMVNAAFVNGGMAALPGVGLALGFAGAAAVVAMGVALTRLPVASAIRYCGENSIVIYLAFFLFMAGMRVALLRLAPELDHGVISLLVTGAGVIGPLFLFWVVRNSRFSFLFRRPRWAVLATPRGQWHSGAHADIPQPQTR